MAKQETNSEIVVLEARVLKYEGKTNGQKNGEKKEAYVGTILVLGQRPYVLKLFIDVGLTAVELKPHTAYNAQVELDSRSNEKGQQVFVPQVRYIAEKSRDFKLV